MRLSERLALAARIEFDTNRADPTLEEVVTRAIDAALREAVKAMCVQCRIGNPLSELDGGSIHQPFKIAAHDGQMCRAHAVHVLLTRDEPEPDSGSESKDGVT